MSIVQAMVIKLFFCFAIMASLAVAVPHSVAADSPFEGKYKIDIEAKRMKCTSCDGREYENEIDITILDLVLKSKARKDLSYELRLEYENDNDGAFFW